jgi:plasmid maintenance system killer protein
MDILFKRKKDRELANNESKLKQKFKGNPRRYRLIRARLDELADADNLAVMKHLPQAYCHELKGNRARQLAVKLDKGFRMVFEALNDPIPRKPDGGLYWSKVTAIRILELAEDYHA